MRTGWNKSKIRHGGGSASKRVLLCALIVLAIACAFALSGCKYSDVLTQHTEDPAAEIDENAEPIYESNPDSDVEMDMANLSLDEADDADAQVAVLPHYDPDAPDNGPTKQLVKSSETPHDEEASEGEEDGEADREGTGEGENGGEEQSNSNGDGDGDNEGSGDPLEDNGNEPTDPSTGSAGGDTVVVDPDGTDEDTAKGTVAAVGEYATIAQMLGGAGALAACDQAWLDKRSSDGCFSGELTRVQSVFSGDGSAAGSCNVTALIAASPSVVLWDKENNLPNLTEDERATIEKAGITVQPVPGLGTQMTEDYEVKSAVAEVANILSGAAGLQFDPSGVLAQYNEFHDDALLACYTANEGYSYKRTDSTYDKLYQKTPLAGLNDSTTTRFITAYVDDVKKLGSTSTLEATVARLFSRNGTTVDISDGVGLSATNGGNERYMLIDYYLQLSGVMNNAYNADKPTASTRYAIAPGKISGTSGFGSRISDWALFCCTGDGDVEANWHLLGDADFNAVLVASDEIAQTFVKSAGRSNGLYRMESPYDIIVVPSGIEGAWSEGHLDSFLLAPWALRIQRSVNLSAAESYLSSFYSTFLRCSDPAGAVQDWDTSYTAQSG